MKKAVLLSVMTVFLLASLFITGCKKEITPPVLTITSDSIGNITQNSITCKTMITSDAITGITVRGVCWSRSNIPSVMDNKTIDGSDIGSFESKITGLTEKTTYYLRAYATNEFGTSYGNILSFKTLKLFPVNGTIVTDIDNNVYHTVIIGNQVWLRENLKTTKYRNGDAITNFTYTHTGAWYDLMYTKTGVYCNYNTDPALGDIYGRLYNWYVIGDSRGVCPAGWHVPSQAEIAELIYFAGGTSVAGGKLKEMGTTHWNSPNTGATNEFGFTLLPSGWREFTSEYQNLGNVTYIWSTTEQGSSITSSETATVAGFSNDDQGTGFIFARKIEGLPIRCVMDK